MRSMVGGVQRGRRSSADVIGNRPLHGEPPATPLVMVRSAPLGGAPRTTHCAVTHTPSFSGLRLVRSMNPVARAALHQVRNTPRAKRLPHPRKNSVQLRNGIAGVLSGIGQLGEDLRG